MRWFDLLAAALAIAWLYGVASGHLDPVFRFIEAGLLTLPARL